MALPRFSPTRRAAPWRAPLLHARRRLDERAHIPELIDQPIVSYPELLANLQDIRRYNRWFGGMRFLLHHLAPVLLAEPQRRWTILDVASGSADVPQTLLGWARRHDLDLRCAALDANALVVRAAAELCNAPRAPCARLPEETPGVRLLQADARALPLRDASVDVVLCSQTLHHLSREQGLGLLRALARLARRVVIVQDLVRHWLPYLGLRAIVTCTSRNRLTRHDGPASVRNSYSLAEWRNLSAAVTKAGYVLHRHFPYRVVLVSRHQPPRPDKTGEQP